MLAPLISSSSCSFQLALKTSKISLSLLFSGTVYISILFKSISANFIGREGEGGGGGGRLTYTNECAIKL